jgi:hypothetical protein
MKIRGLDFRNRASRFFTNDSHNARDTSNIPQIMMDPTTLEKVRASACLVHRTNQIEFKDSVCAINDEGMLSNRCPQEQQARLKGYDCIQGPLSTDTSAEPLQSNSNQSPNYHVTYSSKEKSSDANTEAVADTAKDQMCRDMMDIGVNPSTRYCDIGLILNLFVSESHDHGDLCASRPSAASMNHSPETESSNEELALLLKYTHVTGGPQDAPANSAPHHRR